MQRFLQDLTVLRGWSHLGSVWGNRSSCFCFRPGGPAAIAWAVAATMALVLFNASPLKGTGKEKLPCPSAALSFSALPFCPWHSWLGAARQARLAAGCTEVEVAIVAPGMALAAVPQQPQKKLHFWLSSEISHHKGFTNLFNWLSRMSISRAIKDLFCWTWSKLWSFSEKPPLLPLPPSKN